MTWEKLLEKELNIGKVAARKFDPLVSKNGDTVIVPIGFDVSVDTAYKGNGVITSEYVSSTAVEIPIDKGVAFHVKMTKADYMQVINSQELLGDSVKRAIYKMRNAMDASLGGLYTQAGIVGNSTYVTVSESNAYEILQHMGSLFDEALVEKDGRVAILPSRFCRFIEAQIKNTFDQDEAMKVFGNGYLGKVGRWNVIESENIYNDGTTFQPLFAVAGQSFALAVQQDPEVREERPEGTMDYAMLGDTLYGVKAHRVDKLGTIPVRFSSFLS